jgi:hypothetical protein
MIYNRSSQKKKKKLPNRAARSGVLFFVVGTFNLDVLVENNENTFAVFFPILPAVVQSSSDRNPNPLTKSNVKQGGLCAGLS